MKKIFIFLIMILLLPITTFASDIKITNIEVLSKSDTVTVNESTHDGLTGNLNFKVSEIGDSIKYKITIKNDSTEDFNINLKTNSEIDKYFDYAYTGDTKIEPGKEGSIIVEADYVKNLEKADLENPEYTTNLTLGITSDPLKTDDLVNPNTGLEYQTIFLIGILFLILGIGFYNKYKNESIYKTFILLPLLLIPFMVEANDDEILKININSKIEVPTFTFRFAAYNKNEKLVSSNNLDGGTTDTVTVTNIIEYEIPLKYSSLYDKDFIESGGDPTKIASGIANAINLKNTEEFETAKNALIESQDELLVGYIETSRVITYYFYGYNTISNSVILAFVIEKANDSDSYILKGNNLYLYTDLVDALIATNTRKIVCNQTDLQCTADGNIINLEDSDELLNYATNLNQDFMIAELTTESYNEISIVSKEGYLTNGNISGSAKIANKYTPDNTYDRVLELGYKTATQTYNLTTYVTNNTTLINDENIIYYSRYKS